MYQKSRAEGFGAEVKRRILIGTYVLSHGYYDAYYLQAQKLRRIDRTRFRRGVQGCDVIMGPTSPTTAFDLGAKSDDPVQMYLSDIFTIAVNLAGLPGMSIPAGFGDDGRPVGLQVIGNYFAEARMLNVAHQYQHATDWHRRVPAGLEVDPSMKWEIVVGLESHAQLSTQSKIFSGAATAFGAAPNAQACAVDIALPGVLPVLNQGAVERAIRFGLAVGASINRRSVFARKNYFYPDLPKGYQISQYELPVVAGGTVRVPLKDGEKTVRLVRAHLEEDAGKSLHEDFDGLSGIDLNRAGTPLLEIVTEPDLRGAQEAVAYAKTLHALVRYLEICDGNMQEGSFRCDANVSVRRHGDDQLGTRCEIKNLNSFRFLEKAIEVRGGTPDRHHRGRRQDHAGNTSLRSRPRARRARCAPRKRRTTIATSPIPICCRWKSRKSGWIGCARRCPSCLTPSAHASCRLTGFRPTTRPCSRRTRELATYFEDTVEPTAGRAEAVRELGHGRGLRPPQSRWHSRSMQSPVSSAALAGLLAPYRRRHHLGQDREGRLRSDVGGRGRRRRDHRREGAAGRSPTAVNSNASWMRSSLPTPVRWPTIAAGATSFSPSSSGR